MSSVSRASASDEHREAGLWRWGLILVVATYAMVDVLLVFQTWFLGDVRVYAVVTVAYSQCSLLILWAGFFLQRLVLLLVVVVIVVPPTWLLHCSITSMHPADESAVVWLAAFAIHAAVVAIFVAFQRGRINDQVGRSAVGRSGRERKPWRFDIRSVILLTATIAIILGLLRAAGGAWSWNSSILDSAVVLPIPILGAMNGLVAIAAFQVTRPVRWRSRLLLGFVCVWLLAFVAILEAEFFQLFLGAGVVLRSGLVILNCSQLIQVSVALAISVPDRRVVSE